MITHVSQCGAQGGVAARVPEVLGARLRIARAEEAVDEAARVHVLTLGHFVLDDGDVAALSAFVQRLGPRQPPGDLQERP